MFDNTSDLEFIIIFGAIITTYFCIRALKHSLHDKIHVHDRPLSPNEVANIFRYRFVRCAREIANCVTQITIIGFGVFLAFRPPAVGSTNDHPSIGAVVTAVVMVIIELSGMFSAIMTERLRITLAFLEERGIVTLYGWHTDQEEGQKDEHTDSSG